MIAYKITNLVNGHAYIGITTGTLPNRWYKHVYRAKAGAQTRIAANSRRYGREKFRIEAVACSRNYADLLSLERALIEQEDTYQNGYNLTLGGEGCSGWRPTAAQRKQSSDSRKGKTPLSPEHYARLAVAFRARIFSLEHRARISAAKKGKDTLSPEARARQAQKMREHKWPPRSAEYRARLAAAKRSYWARRRAEIERERQR